MIDVSDAAGGYARAVADGKDRVDPWDTSPASLVQQLCGGAGTPITTAQWQTYIDAAAPTTHRAGKAGDWRRAY